MTLYNSANGLNVTNVFSLNFATTRAYSEDASHVSNSVCLWTGQPGLERSTIPRRQLARGLGFDITSPYHYNYPSVGLSGIISDLVTLPEAISFLKLSGNYAEVGNGGAFGATNNTYSYSPGAGHGFIFRDAIKAIPGLKPEMVKNLEFGLDVKLLENRLGLQFTVYKSNSTNQLLQVGLPVGTGYA